MALQVKKNCYVQLAQATDWFADRPTLDLRWSALLAPAQEEGLILATDHLEQVYKGQWKGAIISQKQALEFPRTGIFDRDGRDLGEVPSALIAAVCILAYKAAVDQEDLSPDIGPGGQPLSESVGPISNSFARGASPLKRYVKVEGLLDPLLMCTKPIKKVKRG